MKKRTVSLSTTCNFAGNKMLYLIPLRRRAALTSIEEAALSLGLHSVVREQQKLNFVVR